MSSKLKFTAILACSVALASSFNSQAAFKRGEERSKPSSENVATPTVAANVPAANNTPQGDSLLGVPGATNPAVTIDGNEFDKIFNDSIAKISKERKAALAKIDENFAKNLDGFTAGKNDETAIQAVQDTLNASGEKYFNAVAKDLSGVSAHLRNKLNELNNKIMQVNAKATSDSIAKAKAKAIKLTEHVDSQSTAFLGHVVNHFTMEAITGDEKIDQLIYNALGNSKVLGAPSNITKTDAQVQDAVKAYITLNAPTLSLSK